MANLTSTYTIMNVSKTSCNFTCLIKCTFRAWGWDPSDNHLDYDHSPNDAVSHARRNNKLGVNHQSLEKGARGVKLD